MASDIRHQASGKNELPAAPLPTPDARRPMPGGASSAPGSCAGPVCASGLCPGAYLLIVLALPPVGWWLLARDRRLTARAQRTLIFLAAAWFGLWPFLAWREVGALALGVLTAAGLILFVVLSGVVWAVRRVFSARRRAALGRIVGGLVAGLAVVLAGCALTLLPAARWREEVKAGLSRPGTFGPAHLDIVEGLPILHLYGTPEEMGRQYGTILRPALRALLRYFQTFLPPKMVSRLRREAMAREPRLPDRFRRELRAAAAAADVPYETLAAANLTPRPNCQVILAWDSATSDGSLLFARNSEYAAPGLEDRGSLIVVWHPADGAAQLSLNLLGMFGSFNGANEHGLCYGNLMVRNAKERDLDERGLPMQFVLRDGGDRFATAAQLRDDLLAQVPIVPMMVAMADPQEACVVELSVSNREARTPVRDYLAAAFVFTGEERRSGFGPFWARQRYETLVRWAEEHHGRIDAETAKGALQATRSPSFLNLHSMVFEPARMRMQVSFNRAPAADGPYVDLDLEALFNTPPATP